MNFLSIKEFDGKLRTNEGVLAATGTLVTLTASLGKDLYFSGAKVSYKPHQGTVGQENASIELQLNGVVIETVDFQSIAALTGQAIMNMNLKIEVSK